MARRTRKPSSASRKPSGSRTAASTKPAKDADSATELDAGDVDDSELDTTDVEVEDDVAAEPAEDAKEPEEDFDGFYDEIEPRRRRRTADPVKRSARRPDRTTSHAKAAKASEDADDDLADLPFEDDDEDAPKRTSSTRSRRGKKATTRASVPAAAKDSTAASTARARSSAEAERARNPRRRVAAQAPNPEWLAPTAVTLLIVGLVYLVTFYLSSGQLPLPIQNWNLLVGFGIMIAGGGLLMRWK